MFRVNATTSDEEILDYARNSKDKDIEKEMVSDTVIRLCRQREAARVERHDINVATAVRGFVNEEWQEKVEKLKKEVKDFSERIKIFNKDKWKGFRMVNMRVANWNFYIRNLNKSIDEIFGSSDAKGFTYKESPSSAITRERNKNSERL